ncbi:MAG TPA: M20/M25/M40 family metallo-hydrolase [Patescibacteria group bacterium]|nr:M20/M25/M40 family metallo-hydrolase [Patescibacteria group bacterium]
MDPSTLRTFLQNQMPNAIEMLQQMVGINSFTANPDGVNRLGRLTAQSFEPLGFKPEFVPSTNPEWGYHLVLTRTGRSRRNIALVAHLDTVFPPQEELANNFRWQMDGDRAFGPGTLDIKGGTVMIWLVLIALQAHRRDLFEDVTWKIFWNSSEERLSPDFENVCRSRLDQFTVAALVFEAENRMNGCRLMVAARKGRLTWKVTVQGRGAHAGGNLQHGANAIMQLTHTLQKIDAFTDFSRNLTFNVATISGGTVLNRVPHEATAEGEFRGPTPSICQEARLRLLALAGPGDLISTADGYRCHVKVEITSESRPWPRNSDTDRLLQLWMDTAARLGTNVQGEERGGLSDGNGLWDAVPTLDGLGPWGDNDHCSERSPDGSKLPEFVEISSFVPKALLNVLAIATLLDSKPRP